jgi:LPXTG-motif cell wall-anchored protein
VAGIVIGVLLGLGLLILAGSYYSKKRRADIQNNSSPEFTTFEQLDEDDDSHL